MHSPKLPAPAHCSNGWWQGDAEGIEYRTTTGWSPTLCSSPLQKKSYQWYFHFNYIFISNLKYDPKATLVLASKGSLQAMFRISDYPDMQHMQIWIRRKQRDPLQKICRIVLWTPKSSHVLTRILFWKAMDQVPSRPQPFQSSSLYNTHFLRINPLSQDYVK